MLNDIGEEHSVACKSNSNVAHLSIYGGIDICSFYIKPNAHSLSSFRVEKKSILNIRETVSNNNNVKKDNRELLTEQNRMFSTSSNNKQGQTHALMQPWRLGNRTRVRDKVKSVTTSNKTIIKSNMPQTKLSKFPQGSFYIQCKSER